MKVMEFDVKVNRYGIITKCTQTPVTNGTVKPVDREMPVAVEAKASTELVHKENERKYSLAERLFIRVNSTPFYKILGATMTLLGVGTLFSGIGDVALMMMALGLGFMFSPLAQFFVTVKNTEETVDRVYSADTQ